MKESHPKSAKQLVALVCAAQVLVQIGAFFWPALLPGMIGRWGLTYSEAGWITAAFYGAYIAAVPILVTLTDRIEVKSVYLSGVAMTVVGHLLFGLCADGFWSAMAARALTGVGWAGTYMTGLKLLADRVEGKLMSRATAGHAASIGISGAVSFACADFIASVAGWRMAFFFASASAALASRHKPRRLSRDGFRHADGAGFAELLAEFRRSAGERCQTDQRYPGGCVT